MQIEKKGKNRIGRLKLEEDLKESQPTLTKQLLITYHLPSGSIKHQMEGADMQILAKPGKNPIRKRLLTFIISMVFLLLLSTGCSHLRKHSYPTLSGTFSGRTQDGRTAKVTITQKSNTIIGRGNVGDQSFGFSGITSFYAPLLIFFSEDGVKGAQLALSSNGDTITVHGLGKPTTLKRGGEPVPSSPGPFAGRFKMRSSPMRVWLDLTQYGELLSGIGYYKEKPVAMAAKVIGPNEADGNLLFSDESRTKVKIILSDDKSSLTVKGIGAPFDLSRQ